MLLFLQRVVAVFVALDPHLMDRVVVFLLLIVFVCIVVVFFSNAWSMSL